MKGLIQKYFTSCFSIGLVIVLLIITGCATTAVMMTVQRPAEVNLKGFERIAIGTISGTDSKDVEDALTTSLVNSGRFEVLDRNHLNRVMQEHNLSMGETFDQSTAAQLGNFIGAAILVFGRVQLSNTDNNVTKEEPYTITHKDGSVSHHQKFTRTVKQTLKVNLQMVDMQTSKIVAIRNLSAENSEKTTADKKTPADIDPIPLKTACVGKVISDFMKAVAPYSVQIKASFQKDKKLPEVESAITQMKIGEWDEAMELLEKAAAKTGLEPKVKAKALYNLGLAQMYGSEYEKSLENIKQAMSLQPNVKLYQNTIVQCKEEKAKADKLKEQL